MKTRIALIAIAVCILPIVTQARWLNPNTGRFQTMDTYEGNRSDPQSLHKYTYGHNNPVNKVDPSGHESISSVMATLNIGGMLAQISNPVTSRNQVAAIKKTALLIHADPGVHGGVFHMAAETHKRELQTEAFWKTPVDASTEVKVEKATTVSAFNAFLRGKSIVYVAYFGHSGPNALYFGMGSNPDTNLSDDGGDYDTPVSSIPKSAFAANAQVRLFGCKAGLGNNSVAQRIASHINKSVWAYSNSGGSLFTQDAQLGHGQRSVTQADIDGMRNIPYNLNKDTWLVPANGQPSMVEFKP